MRATKQPKIGDVVMFHFEAPNDSQAPALVVSHDYEGANLVFVNLDPTSTYWDEQNGEVGVLVFVSRIKHRDEVTNEQDGSVLASHWTELT